MQEQLQTVIKTFNYKITVGFKLLASWWGPTPDIPAFFLKSRGISRTNQIWLAYNLLIDRSKNEISFHFYTRRA